MDNTNDELLEIISALVDPDDCDFDHHGGCQTHGFLSLQPGEVCPNERAKRLLEEHGIDWRTL